MSHKRSKRSRYHIYYDVLKTLMSNSAGTNQIMRACNLDTRLYNIIVAVMKYRGFIETVYVNGVKRYQVTTRGREFVRLYETMLALLERELPVNRAVSKEDMK